MSAENNHKDFQVKFLLAQNTKFLFNQQHILASVAMLIVDEHFFVMNGKAVRRVKHIYYFLWFFFCSGLIVSFLMADTPIYAIFIRYVIFAS